MIHARAILLAAAICALGAAAWARPIECTPPHRHYADRIFYLADCCYVPAASCPLASERTSKDKRRAARTPVAKADEQKVYERE
jgi:hypothetical protein